MRKIVLDTNSLVQCISPKSFYPFCLTLFIVSLYPQPSAQRAFFFGKTGQEAPVPTFFLPFLASLPQLFAIFVAD